MSSHLLPGYCQTDEKPIIRAQNEINRLRTEIMVLKRDLATFRVRMESYESKINAPPPEETPKGWFW
mgnify:FL=1